MAKSTNTKSAAANIVNVATPVDGAIRSGSDVLDALIKSTTEKGTAVATDIVNGILYVAFGSGGSIVVNPDHLSAEIRAQALLHGLKQKLVDAAAIGRNPDTGKSATLADKAEAVMEVWERISDNVEPSWNKVREGGNGGSAKGGLLLQALMEATSKSKAEIEAYLENKSAAEQAALRANPKIAVIISRIQAERDKRKGNNVDTDSMLKDLGI